MDVGTAAMQGDSGPLCPPGVPTYAEARTHRQHRLFIDKKLQSVPNRCKGTRLGGDVERAQMYMD